MTQIIVEFVVVLIGLAVTPVLFYRIPRLPERMGREQRLPTVSVIIPARNEEKNLPLLLRDLQCQSAAPLEIICVDDDSSDSTFKIAESYGVKVISLHGKPYGWTGKSWACQSGAEAASGELLLFLDADVRMGRSGIQRILQAYSDGNCTISVQPFHKTEKVYEQMSILFNLIQIAANGTALPEQHGAGLYGPVILISKADYYKIGKHESVRKSIIEDMALGTRLKEAGVPFRLFVGDNDVSFRMYGDGLKGLLQGWVKNMASGALKTPPAVLAMVFFWVTSMTSVPIHILTSAAYGNIFCLLAYLLLYLVWVLVLRFTSKKIGEFRLAAILAFPVPVAGFLGIFTVSAFKKAFGLKVKWKGRAIAEEEKTCR